MGERDASPERSSGRRSSRFSVPKATDAPKQDELKKAAEAIKQEYKSLLQHLSHLHGIGTSYTDERALSMFAPNMHLPPQLKGLKEQEKERRERLKGLRDQLRERKDSEPTGLADWFESDSGPFLQEKEDKSLLENSPNPGLANPQKEDLDRDHLALLQGGEAGKGIVDNKGKEGGRGPSRKGGKRSREHGDKDSALTGPGFKRTKKVEAGRRQGKERGVDLSGGRVRESRKQSHRGEERKTDQIDERKKVEGKDAVVIGEDLGKKQEIFAGAEGEGEACQEVAAEGEVGGCEEEGADLAPGVSVEERKFDSYLRELKELDSIITRDALELWYHGNQTSGGCEKANEKDDGASAGELHGACNCNSTVRLDDEEVSADNGYRSQFRKDAELAIKSSRSELIKILLELDPTFEPPSLPDSCVIDPETAPVCKAKSRVVIKRKSFFPLPRLKPKEDNPDFAIVRPICVPRIVFNENGSAESVQPHGMGHSETQPYANNVPEAYGGGTRGAPQSIPGIRFVSHCLAHMRVVSITC